MSASLSSQEVLKRSQQKQSSPQRWNRGQMPECTVRGEVLVCGPLYSSRGWLADIEPRLARSLKRRPGSGDPPEPGRAAMLLELCLRNWCRNRCRGARVRLIWPCDFSSIYEDVNLLDVHGVSAIT